MDNRPEIKLARACLKIGSGATPRGGKESYVSKGIALIRSQNVYNNFFDKTGLAFLTDTQAQQLNNVEVKLEDILLNITGDSVARVCQVPPSVLPARVNQHVSIIRPKQEIINSRYLTYFLSSPEMQSHMLTLASSGATRNALTKGMIENFQIPAPSIHEQRAIAHILGTLDDKIELNRRMNETLEAMARALFKSWFVDFDPVKAKAEGRDTGLPKEIADLFPDGFEESELGEIPRGWKPIEFGDVANQIRQNVRPDQFSSETPYIGLEHMPRKSIALTDWSYSEGIESNKSEFSKGDILFGKLRPYFHKVGVAPVNGICSTDIVVISPINPEWFGFILGHASSDSFVAFTDLGSSGTRMPRTSWNIMKRYPVVAPPVVVAEFFSLQIKPIVEKILSNIYESQLLSYLRDSLLPELLSGEISVTDYMSSVDRGPLEVRCNQDSDCLKVPNATTRRVMEEADEIVRTKRDRRKL
jgi:type I restriction enzyme S subunit